ncbi:FAD-dependent pyridine nucleotide-disulphide oxidoreductase [Beutenbergia cavernae DSM 12333]|uniref:FAD-dependent pyridine nucleotide-disulphide oxidoreductase n=1 Tax=Beutenbergia cavernae (strain ATCC BAA-8 / DSM 12333 / CCUG 43141 / JCM 11478 / NBRC 16432 / NCIMB 13614 / HKI 0122) TaxID=471853 RepID=C5C2S4_BEUC1|nr:FAD-dependent oxidoreductase [Beutenbergia cavernae]ACQ81768.1 FAD-dependent pyridine nucleotide-disulphide oxidoreductase [Beutenbergia cavernae DSM 12333]
MKHRIVILGAGYAGASAVGRLAARLHPDDVEITLVNAEPDFVERIRMHQVAAGQELRRRALADALAGTGVTLRVARVAAVDADARAVMLTGPDGASGADRLGYDTLVYALGSSVARHGVPGVAEHAYDVASRPGAIRLRDRLAALGRGGRVVVVGGGLTGIEAASEIAEARPELDVALLVRGGLGDWLSPAGQRHLRATFSRLGVTVHERTAVTGVDGDEVTTDGGARVRSDVTVWTGGFVTHPIAAASSLTVGGDGRIVVDRTMRSLSHPDVYAVGDSARAPGPRGTTLRMSCASGVPMGWQAADSIVARLTGGRLPHMPLGYVQQCISLGRRDGLIQFVTFDDRARSAAFGGRLAARYKELICRGAALALPASRTALPYPARRRRVGSQGTSVRPPVGVAG